MSQKLPDSISVFFPVYNDARSIGKLVEDVREVLRRRFRDWEIILVDDGSTDDSPAVVDRLAASDRRVRAVHHGRNRGYGAAIATGLATGTGELVFYTDGDGQYDPRELDLLLDALGDADVVNGFKTARADHMVRKFEGRLYHAVGRVLFELSVRDIDCDFRLFRRHVVRHILPLACSGGTVGVEMLAKVKIHGYHVAEVPVHHYPRPYGTSQFCGAGRIARAIWQMFLLWVTLVCRKKERVRRRTCRTSRGLMPERTC